MVTLRSEFFKLKCKLPEIDANLIETDNELYTFNLKCTKDIKIITHLEQRNREVPNTTFFSYDNYNE